MLRQTKHALMPVGVVLLLLASALLGLRASQTPPFLWGVNAHDDWATFGPTYVYNVHPITEQVPLLTTAGLNAIRTNCTTANCAQVIATTAAAGVTLLGGRSIMPDATMTEAQNYATGYAEALAFAQAFPAIKYYEVGNEVDDWVGMSGDGSTISQYNAAKYAQARGLLRGAIDGYHAGNPGSKTLVDDAGWCHYGFKQALWADGVRWDITAFHWYSNQGNMEAAGCNNVNVVAIQASFGRPIWITEYNSSAAAAAADPNAEALWISQFITQVVTVATRYNIQGAFIYELFDEPNLTGAQAHYGIGDGTATVKPALAAMLAQPRLGTLSVAACTCSN